MMLMSFLLGGGSQAGAHGLHHGNGVPPAAGGDHPDLHRLQGAGQIVNGLAHARTHARTRTRTHKQTLLLIFFQTK